MKLDFSGQDFKNTQISSFMKIRLVRAEMFYADGGTHMSKLKESFSAVLRTRLKYKKIDWKYYECKKKRGAYESILEIEGGAL